MRIEKQLIAIRIWQLEFGNQNLGTITIAIEFGNQNAFDNFQEAVSESSKGKDWIPSGKKVANISIQLLPKYA